MSSGWLWDENDEFGYEHPKPVRRPRSKPKPKPGESIDSPLSIDQLNRWIKRAIDSQISRVWVEAEISDLSRPPSGHVYLTLKDDSAQMRGVIWRSSASQMKFELEDGMSVLLYGNIDVYSPRGSYQLIIQKVQPKGIGALQLAFQQLQQKLQREGLFAEERKKPLPPLPKRIGVVTSPTGAAIRDFLEVLRRRWQDTEIFVIPSRVQGAGAADEIADAIRLAQDIRPSLDLLIITRGGGSMEDLWCFNEEVVVRSVAASVIPTVSAVGHEIDVSLCDLAADMRALTPSEAAERILPSQREMRDLLNATKFGMQKIIDGRLQAAQHQVDVLAGAPALREPELMVQRLVQRVDDQQFRLSTAMRHVVETSDSQLTALSKQLDALSPLKTMARGFSVVRDPESGQVFQDADSIEQGQAIEVVLHKGKFVAKRE